jgi:hypothetical protein
LSLTLSINAATSPKEGSGKEHKTKEEDCACSDQQNNANSEHKAKVEIVPRESVLKFEIHLHSRGFPDSTDPKLVPITITFIDESYTRAWVDYNDMKQNFAGTIHYLYKFYGAGFMTESLGRVWNEESTVGTSQ